MLQEELRIILLLLFIFLYLKIIKALWSGSNHEPFEAQTKR